VEPVTEVTSEGEVRVGTELTGAGRPVAAAYSTLSGAPEPQDCRRAGDVRRVGRCRVFLRRIAAALLVAGMTFAGTGAGVRAEPEPRTAFPIRFGQRTETIGTFHGWTIWLGWNGSFSDSYAPYSETYNWNTVLAPEGVYVALTSAEALYSGVDVNAGMSKFVGAMVSPDGDRLTWSYFSSLMGVSIMYGISTSAMPFGPLANMGAGFQIGPTFNRDDSGRLTRAIQYSAGFSVSYSLLPIDLPVQVSIDTKSDILGKDTGFYPVIAWDVGEGDADENPLDHIVPELQRLAAISGDAYQETMSSQFARILLPVLQQMRGGAGSVPDSTNPGEPTPPGTLFHQFLSNNSVSVPAGGPAGSIDSMIRSAQEWLDSGDTGQLADVLRDWNVVDRKAFVKATGPVQAATNLAFEMGYRWGYEASGRTNALYADKVVEIQAAYGQPVRVTVTTDEILALLRGHAAVSPAALEGVTVTFDAPPETYIASQATAVSRTIERGRATYEFVQNSHDPFVMAVNIAASDRTGGYYLKLARRIIREDSVKVTVSPAELFSGRRANLLVKATRVSGGSLAEFGVAAAGSGIDATAPGARGKAKIVDVTPSEPGAVIVTITADGFPDVVRSVPVRDTWDVRCSPRRMSLRTVRPGTGKTVTVSVRDRFTKKPLTSGEARLEGCGVDAVATIDASGKALFTGVEPTKSGNMVVTVSGTAGPLTRRPLVVVTE
jgi:hypothetical protein